MIHYHSLDTKQFCRNQNISVGTVFLHNNLFYNIKTQQKKKINMYITSTK